MQRGHLEGDAYPYPANLNTFRAPNDKGLQLSLKVHRPAIEALMLPSEVNREMFTEAFIQHGNHGTLADLCIRQLARDYGLRSLPLLAREEPMRLRLFYDSIDIESPLERIYAVEDKEFWKRLVLAKTTDEKLRFQKEPFDWKSLGISLKYVELVEECAAEFWPQMKMENLAMLVKDFVKDVHIKKLQSLQDYVFDRYLVRDSDTEKSDSTDVSSSSAPERESIKEVIEEVEEEEQISDPKGGGDANLALTGEVTSEVGSGEEAGHGDSITSDMIRMQILQQEWDAFELKRAEEKAKVQEERKEARRARREAQQKRRDLREEKLRARREKLLEVKPQKIIVKNVFDLPIEEEEEIEGKIIDKRNPALILKRNKNYEYPTKHCHHIDLSFLRLFECLNSLTIEFHPPELGDRHHKRHFEFSYQDVERLVNGIKNLQTLRIFRLRDSRMDARKLRMIVAVLKNLNIEVIDFSNDHLYDDCDDAIYELFQNTLTIKSLELEGNKFNINVLRRLSMALRKYEGSLEYLGLARNPLTDEALHALCVVLFTTAQVQHLCLNGLQFSQPTIICCIVNELLRRHKILKKLEIIGMSIGREAAIEMLKVLKDNPTIAALDCRGCDLPFEFEYEIEVCIRRNNYVFENPYIGEPEWTEEEIKEFCGRLKNPVLIEIKARMEQHAKCMEYRPDIAERFSLASIQSANVRQHSESVTSFYPLEKRVTIAAVSRRSTIPPAAPIEPFIYTPNSFNVEEFHEHVAIAGPGQRYFYFQERKGRTLCNREN